MSLFGYAQGILGTKNATLNNLEARVLAIETKYTILGSKYMDLKAQFNTVNADYVDLQGKYSTMQGAYTTLQGQYSAAQAQNVRLRAQVASLSGTITQLDQKITSLEGQISGYQTTIAQQKSQISQLQAMIAADASQITSLKGEISSLNAQIGTLQNNVTADTAQIATLQSTITSLQNQIASLQQQIQAAINANPTANLASGNAPLNVGFAANPVAIPSGSTALFAWDFGDGATGTGANPTHTYQAGSFTPVMTMTVGSIAKKFTLPTITSKANAVINASPSSTPQDTHAPLPVNFTNGITEAVINGVSGTPGTAFKWDFGDGTTSTEANPTHTYANTTNGQLCYTPTLLVKLSQGGYNFSRGFNLPQLCVPPMLPYNIAVSGPTSVSTCAATQQPPYTATVTDRRGDPVPNTRVLVTLTGPTGNVSTIGTLTTGSDGTISFSMTAGFNPFEVYATWKLKLHSLRNPAVSTEYDVSVGCL